jgi:hypothetical protein
MTHESSEGIVVLGMPRSGTTLLRRILDSHPAICAPGESFLFRATSRFLESEEIAFGIDYGVLGGLKPLGFAEQEILARVRALAFGFYEELTRRAGKRRWAAKTAVDSFYLDSIERLYADHVRFVCVLRHGLDVVCSLKEFCDELQGYIAELRPYIERHPRPLEAFAHAWVDVTTALTGLAERRPDSAFLLRYEDLVMEPEATLPRLFAFLGEEWDPALLQRAFGGKEVSGLGDWKTYATRELKSDSIGRWKKLPGDMLSRLSTVVNPSLAGCGYPPVEETTKRSNDDAMRLYELAMMFKSARAGGDANE